MRITPEQRVNYDTARRRVLEFLVHEKYPALAAQIGCHIWPGCNLRAQGLGFADARILKRMRDEGLVGWKVMRVFAKSESWGYMITSKGRVTIKGENL